MNKVTKELKTKVYNAVTAKYVKISNKLQKQIDDIRDAQVQAVLPSLERLKEEDPALYTIISRYVGHGYDNRDPQTLISNMISGYQYQDPEMDRLKKEQYDLRNRQAKEETDIVVELEYGANEHDLRTVFTKHGLEY